jgi:hypothetical protein
MTPQPPFFYFTEDFPSYCFDLPTRDFVAVGKIKINPHAGPEI